MTFSVPEMFVTQLHVNIDRLQGYRHVPHQPFLALFGPRVETVKPCPGDHDTTVLHFTDGSAAAIKKQAAGEEWKAATVSLDGDKQPQIPDEDHPAWVLFGGQPSTGRWLETVERIMRENPRAPAPKPLPEHPSQRNARQ